MQPQESVKHIMTVNNFFKGRMSEQRQEQLAQIEAKKLRETQEKFAIQASYNEAVKKDNDILKEEIT